MLSEEDKIKIRRKGLYLRAICGIRKGLIQDRRIVFLTLTTNSANVEGCSGDDKMFMISKDWNTFKTYLHQLYGDFEFLSVVTNEGNGVIHVLLIGFPFVWFVRLARIWNQVHGMGFIWISKFKGSAERMAEYLMSQYLANQKCSFRFKMSKDFICKGFSHYWRIIRKCSCDWSHMVTKTINGFDVHYYPVIPEKLKKHFLLWIRYYIKSGERLECIPDHFGFNLFVKNQKLNIDV